MFGKMLFVLCICKAPKIKLVQLSVAGLFIMLNIYNNGYFLSICCELFVYYVENKLKCNKAFALLSKVRISLYISSLLKVHKENI